MKRTLFLLFLISMSFDGLSKSAIYETVFRPQRITYNGSDNNHECWESVAQGLLITIDQTTYFFDLAPSFYDRFLTQLADKLIRVEVIFWDESDPKSGLDGDVLRIWYTNELIYGDPH